MVSFQRLIRFAAKEDAAVYFADIKLDQQLPAPGDQLNAYASFDDFKARANAQTVAFGKLLAPTPDPNIPIYCVGLNYQSHADEIKAAAEIKVEVPRYPPLWTKPKASLAGPDEDIPINKFCAQNHPDYEGEFVFLTSKQCRDVSIAEASTCILGYTVGNDLSCRALQHPSAMAGQVYFAKGFDKFAPIGPTLISAEEFDKLGEAVRLTVKVNGEERQRASCPKDLIFKPAEILSHMSQGTTVPAFTAVMTGAPAGVGWFRNGGTWLRDGDVVDIELGGIGVLRNKIVIE